MQRRVRPELLDSDAGTPAEVARALGDLVAINRRFGGIRTMRRLVARVAAGGARRLSLLDVGAGSGDVPAAVAAALARSGVRLDVTLCDRAATHLPRTARRVIGNGVALPFRDTSFDLVTCSLFLHHLEPVEIGHFLRESLRVARRALLINDLRRSWAHLGVVHLGAPLFKSSITRHDARVSVRRAYTPRELAAMLRAAGVQHFEIQRRYLYRMGAVVWK